MNFYVAVADYDWFRLYASKAKFGEVNFWRPSPEVSRGQMQEKLENGREYHMFGPFVSRRRLLEIQGMNKTAQRS